MTRHQYGIYALDPQTSFRGETVGGVQKCRLFFQATTRAVKPRTPAPRKTKSNILNFPYKKKTRHIYRPQLYRQRKKENRSR